nr:MAG TPA: hypothetical protein [Caudoviricetes sp.]
MAAIYNDLDLFVGTNESINLEQFDLDNNYYK